MQVVENFVEYLIRLGSTNRFEDAIYIPIEADEIENYMVNREFYANKHP